MQDMIPKGERSIRNIPLPPGHRRPPMAAQEEEFPEPVLPHKKRTGMIKNWFFWILIGVLAVCAVGGILLSTFFAGVTISVTPKTAVVTPPPTMLAQINAPVGVLPYQVVSASRTASTTVKAGGSSQVSKSASGVITIYNNYNTSPQTLVATTRFAAPNGNIYRIKKDVTVPGATKAADGTLTPGSVSAMVYADAPGAAYNLGQTQFTIPGFKGDPRYTAFYAQASSISGGFVGAQAAVAPADLTAAQGALEQGLKSALQQAAATQIPKQYLLIPSTFVVTYGDITQTPIDANTVALSETATANGDTVRTSDLAAAIAKQVVTGYNGEAVDFADTSAITIGLQGSSTPSQGSLTLALSGSPTLVWQFDPNALKTALVGKSKSAFEQIVSSFAPAITCSQATPCSASIRPFWSSTFPTDVNKITVVTK
jgi:hypothetical protein